MAGIHGRRWNAVHQGRGSHPLPGDRDGIGGFYEAILAMMIVSAGMVLLACSFTFLAADQDADDEPENYGREIMNAILANRTVSPSDRILDQRILERVDWPAVKGDRDMGMAVFLSYPDGSSRTLYSDQVPNLGERFSFTEPVNVKEHGGRISACLLVVRVWQ